MAKDKKQPRKTSEEERKQPLPRSGKPLNVWIQEELRDALDALLKQTRRSLTAEVSIALEKHLRENGLWPPKDAE